jgi:ATP/maltotriose-dependent transcriptional regulator MalT
MTGIPKISYPGTRFQPKVTHLGLVDRTSPNFSYKKNIKQQITLMCAPTGFGKTVLMYQWFQAAVRDGVDCIWFNFESTENSPLALLAALDASVGQAFELTSSQCETPQGLDQMMRKVTRSLENHTKEVFWFWDAIERVITDDCTDLIARLIENLPKNVRLVMSSKIDPQWNRINLFLQDRIKILTQQDLGFSLTETKRFFDARSQTNLDENQIYKLASCVEGWPAAIKLASIGFCEAESQGEINQVIKGEYKLIYQFIESNLLSELPKELVSFIYKTSHLSSLNADLCNEINEISESAEKIQDMVDRGLLKENKYYASSYRYPSFISVYLKNTFAPNLGLASNQVREKTVAWYRRHEDPSEALYHALFLPEMTCAIEVFEYFAKQLVVSGEIALLKHFFDRLSPNYLNGNPLLQYAYVWTLIITQEFSEAKVALEKLKVTLSDQAHNESLQCDTPNESEVKVLEYRIRQALDLDWSDPSVWMKLKNKESESNTFLKEQIELSLGAAYLRKERFSDAYTAFMEAERYADINETPITGLSALAKMAYIRNIEGRLVEALTLCDDAIDLSFQKYSDVIPVVAVPLLVRSEIHYEFSHLVKSEEDHIRASKLFEKYKSTKYQVQAIIHGAKIGNYYHGPESALVLLAKAKNIVTGRPDKYLHQLVSAAQIRYYILNAELSMAESVLRHEGISIESRNPNPTFYCSIRNEAIYCSFCFYLIAVGRFEAASAWLTKMLHQAQAQGRYRFCLDVAGLLVLAHASGEDVGRSMRTVREMLMFGERAGAIQSILDLGDTVVTLIKKFQQYQTEQAEQNQRGPSEVYVQKLLAYSSGDIAEQSNRRQRNQEKAQVFRPTVAPSKGKIDSLLTPREIEVLRLICDGYSNKSIANELILGEGTVKWHVKNIFAKLDVASRTQAASAGRQMGLV